MRRSRNLSFLLAILFSAVIAIAQTDPRPPAAGTQTTPAALEPENPTDLQLPQSDVLSREANPGDPLLDVPPLPKGRVTMEGGIIAKVDPIRDRLLLIPFGAKERMRISFDERTHFFRDGRETTQAVLHQGDRVYVDTMLDGPRVFARNVHIVSQRSVADVTGQVVAFNAVAGKAVLRDRLSGSDVSVGVRPETRVIDQQGQTIAQSWITPGAIVSVHFLPAEKAANIADELRILARPGQVFTFSGKITNVDLRNGMIAVNNQSDNEIYDIAFDPKGDGDLDHIRMGAQVTVKASFTGKEYKAESVSPQ